MATAADILSQELEVHRLRRADIKGQVSGLRSELASLSIAIDTLESVLAKLSNEETPPPANMNGHTHRPAVKQPDRSSKKATHVAFQYVQDHPEGTKPSDVADAISHQIISKSSDRRRVVMNTLINLVNRGKIARGDDGKYRPVPANGHPANERGHG
jgi:hypothetical protein